MYSWWNFLPVSFWTRQDFPTNPSPTTVHWTLLCIEKTIMKVGVEQVIYCTLLLWLCRSALVEAMIKIGMSGPIYEKFWRDVTRVIFPSRWTMKCIYNWHANRQIYRGVVVKFLHWETTFSQFSSPERSNISTKTTHTCRPFIRSFTTNRYQVTICWISGKNMVILIFLTRKKFIFFLFNSPSTNIVRNFLNRLNHTSR